MKYAPYSLLWLVSVPVCLLGIMLLWPLKEAPSVEAPGKFYIIHAGIPHTVDSGIHDTSSMAVKGEPGASDVSPPYRSG